MDREALISEIKAYCERTGLAPSTVCERAIKHGKLFKRLEAGGDCATGTAARLREWMRKNPTGRQATDGPSSKKPDQPGAVA